MSFTEILPKDLTENAIKLIGLDWMLITSGNIEKFNMMTASWGGLGVLWHKPVCFIFVRPSRYTFEFLKDNEKFSLTFYNKDFRSILNFCGTKSGRDINKMKDVELTPIEEENTIYFEEAKLVLICKKLYYHDLKTENFLYQIQDKFYKDNNYHRLYIGEIIHCYKK
ncbi:MAG: flavin reductase family protein [Candidatus Heimdallarchaeota archaeon]|nr:flavin reductase family protein [Candidatus Heimdallarchaeota archaeon]